MVSARAKEVASFTVVIFFFHFQRNAYFFKFFFSPHYSCPDSPCPRPCALRCRTTTDTNRKAAKPNPTVASAADVRLCRSRVSGRPSPFTWSRNVETPSSLTRRRRSVLPLSASVAPARNGYQDVDLSSPSPSTPANEKTDFSRRGHREIASRPVRADVGPGVAHRPQREDFEKSRQQGTFRASNAPRRYAKSRARRSADH